MSGRNSKKTGTGRSVPNDELDNLQGIIMNARAGEEPLLTKKTSRRAKKLPAVSREPNETERGLIAQARQTLAEMSPRFEVGTKVEIENGTTKVIQGPRHSDMDGWKAQFMAALGTSSKTVANVEVERIAKALRQSGGKIDPAELDTVIAIVSGQKPKNELEAMLICQMAVTHALTMRSFGNMNRCNEILQQNFK